MAVIDVKKFKKSFGAKVVHQDVTFSVFAGECLGLLGGSGTGKSVILRSLIGLEKPDAGQIEFEGQDIVPYSEEQLFPVRKEVAYVFQNGALFDSMTVFENLEYPLIEHTDLSPSKRKEKITSLLREFNLVGTDKLLPAELSGGMQKRVGLARAIIINPKVILYDEPTAGLDPANTVKIQDLILNLKKRGVTSILVSHDMETALRVCDRVCFLKDGQIENLGSVKELVKNKFDIMDLFLRSQND